jgi:Tol biopolymer transport system component
MDRQDRRIPSLSCRSLALLAALALVPAAPAGAQGLCALSQVSVTTTGISFNASVDAGGIRVAFTSTGEPVPGGNPDASSEVFLYTLGVGTIQITSSTGFGSFAPSLSADASRIAFVSEADLTGGNADLNRELFLWESGVGITQLTSTPAMTQVAGPSISADGSRIAFSSDADVVAGQNADGNEEVFLWQEGAGFTQITDTTAPAGASVPDLSGDGQRIALASSGDLVPGSNADGNVELFLWDSTTGFSQLTDTALPFTNVNPSIDADGSRISFQRGLTGPGNAELWIWDSATGLTQVTSALDGSSGPSSVSGTGQRVAFDFNGDPVGDNADGNGEIFLLDGATLGQVTVTPGPSGSGAPAISTDGRRIAFLSSLDLVGMNPEENQEIYLADCGLPPVTAIPTLAPAALALLALMLATAGLAAVRR